MRLQEFLIENPVAPAAAPATTAQAPAAAPAKSGFLDKALSGAAKVAGAIDKTANFTRGFDKKLSGSRTQDPFAVVKKSQVSELLTKVTKQQRLTPQELAVLQKFLSAINSY